MLHTFIAAHRGEIIKRCREKAACRYTAAAVIGGLDHGVGPKHGAGQNHGVPVFLRQLEDALLRGLTTNPDISRSAVQHGHDLLRQGLSVSQVVHNYGDVCQAVTELAVELRAPISTEDFRTLNRCLDDAIAGAVSEYGRARTQSGIDGESARGSERLGFFAHELRNLINTAILAFEVLKTGNVGVAGSTGAVLHRSLLASHALVIQSLAEVRVSHGNPRRERLLVSTFIREVAAAATLEAKARGVTLAITPVADDVAIHADRQVLAAVVANLLQNAFKFTRPRTNVILRVGVSTDRVLIEVEDECGGLPDGNANELFRPFVQCSVDRTGVGLGLAYSRWGAEANDGRLSARDLPTRGCIFTVDLPRMLLPAAAPVLS